MYLLLTFLQSISCNSNSNAYTAHCKPSPPFDKQFCVAYTAMFTSYITFQSNIKKYFSQGKSDLMNFLFVLYDKIKIFTLKTVYFTDFCICFS